ncbi:MAG: amidohydrolase, partial [Terriglobia bacterium]
MQTLEAHCPNHTSSQPLFVYGGANVAHNAFDQAELNLHVQRGLITKMCPRRDDWTPDSSSQLRIDLHGCQVLPGLINAHDHLGFGLFPRLGNGPYADAKTWATEIYRPDESPLRELLSVSKPTRLFWGGLRNLLSGVTTVCHHNPYDEMTFRNHFPVRVAEAYRWIHSLDFFSDTES